MGGKGLIASEERGYIEIRVEEFEVIGEREIERLFGRLLQTFNLFQTRQTLSPELL